MTMSGVVVVGSLNVDHIINVDRFVQAGETMHSNDYKLGPGGKGFNQCVALRRLMKSEYSATMCGRIGLDNGGKMLERLMIDEGIKDGLTRVEGVMTGTAFVFVDSKGQNEIVLHGGTNMTFTVDQLDGSILQDTSAVILQLEIPLLTVIEVARLAVTSGTKVILNPAPYQPLKPKLLECVDYLILNETEASQLTGDLQMKLSPWARATKLLDAGVRNAVILTQGNQPTVVVYREGGNQRVDEIPPPVVSNPVDTTAAGDAFIGAFVGIMVESAFKIPIQDAIRFANCAGALTITRHGAATSIPKRFEVEAYMQNN